MTTDDLPHAAVRGGGAAENDPGAEERAALVARTGRALVPAPVAAIAVARPAGSLRGRRVLLCCLALAAAGTGAVLRAARGFGAAGPAPAEASSWLRNGTAASAASAARPGRDAPDAPPRRGTGGLDEPGYRRSPRRLSPRYLPRTALPPERRANLSAAWGAWTRADDPREALGRPREDFFAGYPHRDAPGAAFPPGAWQRDAAYLGPFLNESLRLVERALEAILGEYGHGRGDRPGVAFAERARMFHVNLVDGDREDYEAEFQEDLPSCAGFMFRDGWADLQRRLLHAIVTEDAFTFVTGGHSAAAGHGNHFVQSYTLQMGRIMEPVLARLGVFFRAHNLGMGGLGTIQHAMGAKDLYGEDIDIIYWDSKMTENNPHQEFFLRAVLMSGNRAPVIWNMLRNKDLWTFARSTGASVGLLSGGAMAGIRKTLSMEQAKELPWASQYIDCDSEIQGDCSSSAIKYNTKCWIDREDYTPPYRQSSAVGGQASWHPGWRHHQLLGRILAFALLRALHAALTTWQAAEAYILPDEAWHVGKHYESIRSRAINTNLCMELKINPLFCSHPHRMNARTEFTPRVLGYQSSIRSIMKGDHVPRPRPNLYDPPDVVLAFADPPEGEVNALQIIENGMAFPVNRARARHVEWLTSPPPIEFKSKDYMEPGRGIALADVAAAADNCDGTADSFCARNHDCLLSGHNDKRGGILFDGLSGWLTLNLANVEHGFVAVKMELWRTGGSPATLNWTCENNLCGNETTDENTPDGRRLDRNAGVTVTRRLHTGARRLKEAAPEPCPAYQFQFAMDGEVTSWDWDTFNARRISPARVVDIFELVNDKNITSDGPRDVEFALRLTGCNRLLSYSLTHIYWA